MLNKNLIKKLELNRINNIFMAIKLYSNIYKFSKISKLIYNKKKDLNYILIILKNKICIYL